MSTDDTATCVLRRTHHLRPPARRAKRPAHDGRRWRGDKDVGKYADVPGFCKAAAVDDIRKHGHVLTPGRYVGAGAAEEDGEPFEEKVKRLTATLRQQTEEGARLDAAIRANLTYLGYGE